MGCAGKVKFGACSSLLIREELPQADRLDLKRDEKELMSNGGGREEVSLSTEPEGRSWWDPGKRK